MCWRTTLALLALLATSAGASAVSGGLRRAHAPLVAEAAPGESTPIAQRTLRASVDELAARVAERLPARAVSFARWAGGQAPPTPEDAEKLGKESTEVAEEGATTGVTGLFLLSPWEILGQTVLGLILLILFGILYKKYKPQMMDDGGPVGTPRDLDGGWKYGFCDCFSAPKTCCIACCFPAVRWADTIDMTNQLSFWAAVAAWWVLSLFNMFAGFAFAIVTGVLGAYYRQQIRGIFEIDNCTPKTIVEDFFSYCCCPCLAIVQEARQVEQALTVGHKSVIRGVMEEEEVREKEDEPEVREKEDNPNCPCGNVFLHDAAFCRKCGAPRPK